MSRQTFIADSFPHVWPNCGPGVLATFIGGELEAAEDTVWFKPAPDMPSEPTNMHLDRLNPDSYWFERIEAIAGAAAERWQGLVQIGMTDLGGTACFYAEIFGSSRKSVKS